MKVKRITTGTSSRVEPPLEEQWSDLTKLRWHAAVVSLDTGSEVRILVEPSTSAWKPRWSPFWISEDSFQITVGDSTAFPFDFHSAWTYLNGVSAALTASRSGRV